MDGDENHLHQRCAFQASERHVCGAGPHRSEGPASPTCSTGPRTPLHAAGDFHLRPLTRLPVPHGTTKEAETGSHAATWSSGGTAEASEEPPGSGFCLTNVRLRSRLKGGVSRDRLFRCRSSRCEPRSKGLPVSGSFAGPCRATEYAD